jgi:hypothetical protein
LSQITSVQLAKWNASSNTSAPTATFDSPPPLDSIIIAVIALNENAGDIDPTISGFTAIVSSNNPGYCRVKAFYKIAGPSESATVTASLSASRPCAIMILNYQNVDTVSPIDVNAANAGTTTTVDSGSAVTGSVVAERHIAAYCSRGHEAAGAPTHYFAQIISSTKDTGNADTSYGYGVATVDYSGPAAATAHTTWPLANLREWTGLVFTLKQRVTATVAKTAQITAGGTAIRATKGSIPSKSALLKAVGVIRNLKGGRASIIVDNTKRVFGLSSAKVDTIGAIANEGVYWQFTPSATDIYTVSVYLESAANLRLRIATAAGVTVTTGAVIPATNKFTRVKLTSSANLSAGTAYRFYIETAGTIATTFWIDGAQVEQNPDATPFVQGSRPSGQGPVGDILRAQKPAALVMDYVVWIGGPGTYVTYQQVYDNHLTYTHLLQTRQAYQDVYTKG